MAGTFDPNQAQNLAEVRPPVSKGQPAKGFVCCWGRLDRETVRIQDRSYPAAAGGFLLTLYGIYVTFSL